MTLHIEKVSEFSKIELENEFYGHVLYTNFWSYILHLLMSFAVYFLVAICLEELNHSFLAKPNGTEVADNVSMIQLGEFILFFPMVRNNHFKF